MSRLADSCAEALRTSRIRLLLAILIVAALVQIVYFVRIQALYPDYGLTTEHYYSPLAVNLLHHGTYGAGEYPDIEKSTKRPPLYSVVLAGVYGTLGENQRWGLVLNNILLWLTIIVVYRIGSTFSPAIGLLAAILFVLDPVGVMNANKNTAGVLYGMLFALFFLVALRTFSSSVTLRLALLSSLLLGLATLTRAPSVYLGTPLVLAFLATHRWLIKRFPWRRLALLALALFSVQAVIVGGWMLRNRNVTGNSEFAGMASIHLYSFFVPLVIGQEEGVSYEVIKTRLQAELRTDEKYLGLESEGARQRYLINKSYRLILQHPMSTARVILEQIPVVFLNYPQAAASMFLGENRRESVDEFLSEYALGKTSRLDVTGYWSLFKTYVRNGFGLLLIHGIVYKLYYLSFMIAGALGTLLLVRNPKHRVQGILFAVVISYMVLVFATWPSARLRLGILPIYSVAAAWGAAWAWSVLGQLSATAWLIALPTRLTGRLKPPRAAAE